MSPLSPSRTSSHLENPNWARAAAAAAAPTTPPRVKRTVSAFFDYSPGSGSDSSLSSPTLSSGASSTVSSPFGKMTFSSPKRRVAAITVPDDQDDDDIFFDRTNLSSSQEDLDIADAIPNARFEIWTKERLISLSYSQNSILSQTSTGLSLQELQKSIAKGWSCNESEALTVVQMPDDTFVSLDNRRLYCIKQIAKIARSKLSIPVKIHHHAEIAESKYLSPISADIKKSSVTILQELKSKMAPFGIQENSYGFCAYARMRVFTSENLADSSFGFTKAPRVRA